MSDIDICFKDCHKYQKYIDDELTPEQSWQVIEWKTGTQDYKPDIKTIEFIKKVLKQKCKNAESYLIQEHDEIIGIIETLGNYHHVTNFDYHHDITYGNDDTELTIENWVKWGRDKDLISNYLWVCQDSSEVCYYSPFNFKRTSWKDLSIDNLPEYDIVVFCISHQFTPPKYWNIAQQLREYLHNEIKHEFVLCPEPTFDENKYPHYVGKDNKSIVKASAWYKYFGYYINGELIDNVVWLSIIRLNGDVKEILGPCQKIISDILKYYKVGFCWDKGYKTEKFIKRLICNHHIFKEYEDDIQEHIILKKEK